ncbi:MAG: helix-hairpin-helix domain-containing protein [Phycisphaerae bacterium]|nr:helix-hairpin-helix domain-containing protein [Phycisphaerae bacterium]
MDDSDDINQRLLTPSKTVFFAGVFLALLFALPSLHSSSEIKFGDFAGLNPNFASVGELAQLPSVGPGKAQAIVDYRNERYALDKEKVFENIMDIEKIKGFGPKSAEKLKQFFEFGDK